MRLNPPAGLDLPPSVFMECPLLTEMTYCTFNEQSHVAVSSCSGLMGPTGELAPPPLHPHQPMNWLSGQKQTFGRGF